ncbi:MAG: aminotransferase class I/II-fold pyridoxal phosphate-dependent enzyme, partial [Lentisphaerae bacterium]|nr:aminotransferase class I/II-fold pyridoxal phosphate-dependent enzyme [Lentisphaerota bacterium]
MLNEAWILGELEGLRDRALERRLAVNAPANGRIERGGEELVNFASNDYLGLAQRPEVIAGAEAALRRYGAGASSSRLLTGTLPCHEAIEARLAEFKGHARALVFGSGYHANLAAVTALAGRGDAVFLDRLCHASLVDGAVLSRADVRR